MTVIANVAGFGAAVAGFGAHGCAIAWLSAAYNGTRMHGSTDPCKEERGTVCQCSGCSCLILHVYQVGRSDLSVVTQHSYHEYQLMEPTAN
jgi:hypothetical protein